MCRVMTSITPRFHLHRLRQHTKSWLLLTTAGRRLLVVGNAVFALHFLWLLALQACRECR
jgi:hypothetical protein